MRVPVIVLVLSFALPAWGHDLRYDVRRSVEAVSVRLFFADGNAFAFKSYEIYRVGEKIPFQVGRTDALGRIVFLPDRRGSWRVKAFSEDGHGVDFSLSAGPRGAAAEVDRPLVERYPRAVVGAGLIFGLFGLIDLFVAWRRGR